MGGQILTVAVIGSVVVFVVSVIWILVIAFNESVKCGLLSIFIPFYSLHYVSTRWAKTKRPFFVGLIGVSIFVVGYIVPTLTEGGGEGYECYRYNESHLRGKISGKIDVHAGSAEGSTVKRVEFDRPDVVLDVEATLEVEEGTFKLEFLGKDNEVTLALEASSGQKVSGSGYMVTDDWSNGKYRVTATEAKGVSYHISYRTQGMPEAAVHSDLGLAYVNKGMFDEAIAKFKKALEIGGIFPGVHTTYTCLGAAYLEKEMYNKAIAEFKKALEINPDYAQAHYHLGLAYAGKGMYDEAIAEYKRTIEIRPDHAMAHHNLAVAYHREGEYSLAIKHCDRVIELGYEVDPELLKTLEPYRKK